jgi:hypothetical protein
MKNPIAFVEEWAKALFLFDCSSAYFLRKTVYLSLMRIQNTTSAPMNKPRAAADMNAHLYKLIALPRTRPRLTLHMGIAVSREGMVHVASDQDRTERKVKTIERQMTGMRTVGCTWHSA